MIDARLFGFIALSFVLLLLYQAWVADYGPQPVEPVQSSSSTSILPQAEDLPVISGAEESLTVKPSSQPVAELINVETDVLSLSIDTQGGTIVRTDLLEYPVELDEPDTPVRIFSTGERLYVAQSGLQVPKDNALGHKAPDHYAFYTSDKKQYQLEQNAQQLEVPLSWQDPSGVKVTKIFTFTRGSYVIGIRHVVQNQSDRKWVGGEYLQFQRNHGAVDKKRLIITYTGGVIYSEEKKYEKIDFEEMVEQPLNRRFSNGWAAIIQHYFVSAWVPEPEQLSRYYSRGIQTSTDYRYILGLNSPLREILPGETSEFSSRLFVGPKLQDQLKETAKGLELTVDYGLLTIISQPLFWLLKNINNYIGNWGWSIIVLTILIKLVFFKLAETSYRSMAKMRQAQPKMLQVRERYANDRQRQGQAMMELYKKEKINPLGGCLPMLIQIPVFIALYWVLLESVEIRQAPFILWIKDLSSQDPFFVLPIIMGVTMYIQQKLNPAPIDPVQAKVFMILPFVFTVMFAFFPAGLVLYWVVNNTFTIIQQWVITKRVMESK